ncbi:unnamed protein product [Toxocara canis]|uniref:Abnormal pharyngeal pumping eat-20 n=1 Tax=Toxocara canis TaxID=6265 RepID=A0A183V6I0_TOXCA|nr:unnamed protein product [Toxocara canis]
MQQEAHFADPSAGRISWVIDESGLPWTGAYHFLSSLSAQSTVLLTVVDSSNGNHLGECTTSLHSSDWQRFFWTLSEDALLCNVSGSVVSKVRFPPTHNPRTFSVRILAGRGPRCFRDLIVQNERPAGCPPLLRRNLFQQTALDCGCEGEAVAVTTQSHTDAPTTSASTVGVAFPIFQLTRAPTLLNTFPNGTLPTHGQLESQLGLHLSSAATGGSDSPSRWPTEHFSSGTTPSILPGHFLPFTTPYVQGTTVRTLSTQPCAQVECQNNGTCVLGPDGQASCLCLEGFNGERCEFSVCATMPCMNGGICRASGTEASCECPPGLTGVLCEQAICDPKCENGGSCELVNDSAICQCLPGTTGINCNLIDVCVKPSTCSVFGVRARCRIDEQNFALISPIVMAAKSAPFSPVIEPQATTLPSFISNTAGVNHTLLLNKTDGQQESSTSGEVPFPLFASSPSMPSGFTAESTFEPRTDGTTGSSLTDESSEAAVLKTEGPKGVTTSLPDAVNETATSVGIVEVSTPPGFVHSVITANNSAFNVSVLPPFLSFTVPTITDAVTGIESTSTSSPSVPQTSLSKSESISHISGLPWSPFERVTEEGVTEPTLITKPESTMSSIVLSTTTGVMMTEKQQTESTDLDEAEQRSTTGQQMTLVTTTETLPEEEPTENSAGIWQTEMSSHMPEVHTETPEISLHGNGAGEEVVTSENDRYPTVEHTTVPATHEPVGQDTSSNQAHEVSDGTSKRSSTSWIVALVIAIVLLLLVVAAALFVLRYVQRSRKLHGKYNPAREENVLANSYSMPMTTVTKEERLI